MEKKKLEEIKDLLIVVDMVNGFVREGALADPYIATIIPEIKELIELNRERGGALAFINEAHTENAAEFKTFPRHCVKGTIEAEVIDELQPEFREADLVYGKNSTAGIFAIQRDIEAMQQLREVIITGCCTDICDLNLAIPLKNLLNEYDRDVRVVVPRNAVETFQINIEHNNPDGTPIIVNGEPFVEVIHPRDEYNEMAFKLLDQAGVETPKQYIKER